MPQQADSNYTGPLHNHGEVCQKKNLGRTSTSHNLHWTSHGSLLWLADRARPNLQTSMTRWKLCCRQEWQKQFRLTHIWPLCEGLELTDLKLVVLVPLPNAERTPLFTTLPASVQAWRHFHCSLLRWTVSRGTVIIYSTGATCDFPCRVKYSFGSRVKNSGTAVTEATGH